MYRAAKTLAGLLLICGVLSAASGQFMSAWALGATSGGFWVSAGVIRQNNDDWTPASLIWAFAGFAVGNVPVIIWGIMR